MEILTVAVTAHRDGFADRILEQLLRLRAQDAVRFEESTEPRDVFQYRFRAAGWPIDVVVDQTVLELRVYHGRDVIATGAVHARVAGMLTGAIPVPASMAGGTSPDEARAALRAIVGDWRKKNARVGIQSPHVARHPDGWNNA